MPGPPSRCLASSLGRPCFGDLCLGDRDHADRTAAAPGAELDRPRNQREQRVVAAAAHAHAGVEVGAVLPHDDLAGADQLAAEALDAEPLGVGVPAVTAGRGALLVCHLSPSSLRWPWRCWPWPGCSWWHWSLRRCSWPRGPCRCRSR